MRTLLRFVSLSLLALAAPHLAHAQGGPGGPPPAVGTTVVAPQSITESDEFVGRIQSTNRVALVARVTGFLTKQLFTEGAEVKTGDLLYQIEKPPFEADVQAKQAAVAQANAQLQNASITLGRAQTLLNTPAGQRSTVDDATASQRSQAAMLLGGAGQPADVADQSRLHRHHGADRRQDRADARRSRSATWSGRSTAPLATIVSQDPMYVLFPIALRSALDLRDRYADKGGTAAIIIKLKLPTGKIYDQDRPYRLYRPDRGGQYGHGDHPRRHPQPVLSGRRPRNPG